jgi:LCP family protein required for cell wall assembly
MNQNKKESLPDLKISGQEKYINKTPKKKNGMPIFLKIILGVFILLLLSVAIFSFKIASVGKDVFQSEKDNSILTQIKHLILDDNKKIEGEEEGRTNILLLGIGGEGHEGALLTDTIMVASIKYNENQEPEVAFISIPRDLAVPLNNSNYVKINSIYAYGKMNHPDDDTMGNKLITDYINKVTGLPIHYYVQIDFDGFKQIVDSIGGIEVDVQNSFYDSRYPTEDFGYQKISFEKGLTKMDGDLALKYARSRHGIVTEGTENEGSDFARAKRQQQILTSFKDKTFSVSTVINPKKVNEILNSLGSHVRTNVEPWEVLKLLDIAQNINNENIINKVIDQESGLLKPVSKNNNYLLMPNDKNYLEIKQVFLNIFNLEEINTEKSIAKLAILNGTAISGLANKSTNQLLKESYKISHTGNASKNDYEKTVIYDLTAGKMPNVLANLKEKFNANLSTATFSEKISINPINNIKEIDFIIILGLDSDI